MNLGNKTKPKTNRTTPNNNNKNRVIFLIFKCALTKAGPLNSVYLKRDSNLNIRCFSRHLSFTNSPPHLLPKKDRQLPGITTPTYIALHFLG